ncbi:uncharacterized protein FYW61_015533 isoform 2-T2 [Anableps anableps]
MNLYRSFGNLMEAYVYEERTRPDSQWQRDNTDGPHALVSNVGVNPRSDSVDSGVETASCETPNPATVSSFSADNTEMDLFLPQSDRFSSASTPQPPVVLSTLPSSLSSSPNLRLSRAEEDPRTLQLKGEPELQRTDSKRWKQVYEGKELSPGLCYLEWVCQRMEQYAKHRMQNQAMLMETDTLQEHEEQKIDSADAQEGQPRLENAKIAKEIPSEPQQQKSHHFRQRSASDTTFSKLHLKKLNLNSRGQRLSTNDLREIEEEDISQMESIKEESSKKNIIQRLKLGSLRRVGSIVSDNRSQQMQSSEKISARRRLSQLFRRTRKVSPD